jgi:hypothetical protein
MASASDHRAHAALQPADCLILLPQRLPAAVETSIGPAHYPAECTQSDAFLQPSLRARKGRANSNSLQTLIRYSNSFSFCGKVPLYATYRELVTDAICVDWGNTEHKNRHLDRELDLTNNLPFRDDEFDTIILSDVLEQSLIPLRPGAQDVVAGSEGSC